MALDKESAENRLAALRARASRGIRAARFLGDEFWRDEFEPEIAKFQQRMVDRKHWGGPGSTLKTVDEIATNTAYCSGADEACSEVMRIVGRMIEDGQEAERELKRLEEASR